MCGIAGFVDFQPAAESLLLKRARQMADHLGHRGPDAASAWADADAGFATGHRRLSVVELSEAGAQPMVSHSGRFVLSYNGEVYNAMELRRELQPKRDTFRGHSDTEVILEALAEWGVANAVRRFVGMFAFALWDRQERKLWLVRDRLGIKPLYWGRFENLFIFGSELKALRMHPYCRCDIDRNAIAAYLRFAYVPAPHSIYSSIYKLPPGCLLEVNGVSEPTLEHYWTLADTIQDAQANPFSGSDAEAEQTLNDLLGDAIKRRMISDVPLGAFLSGGVDSSAIVALMQSRHDRPVRTFTIGFDQADYDEAPHAKKIAAHLGTDHTELYVTPQEARDVVPSLAEIWDEPFADSSQIPTYLLSTLTRRHVTVALSGDGGDEMFCGYNRYFFANAVARWHRALPTMARQAISGILTDIPVQSWDRLVSVLPSRWRVPQPGNKAHRLAEILRAKEVDLYLHFVSQWHQPERLVYEGHEPASIITSPEMACLIPDLSQRMRYLDAMTYLPDDILTKVDRASMAASLEVRVPMIDPQIVKFAHGLPRHLLAREGKGKWLLRRVLQRYVPERLTTRPKTGFGVPIDSWLRGPLREWAEDLLSEPSLRTYGLLDSEPIRQAWREHLDHMGNNHYKLWTILMLQSWLQRWHQGRHSEVEDN